MSNSGDRTTPGTFPSQRNDLFCAAIDMASVPMVVTDPHQTDNPIIYANPAFQQLSGFEGEELIGRNCRLLQGPDTDPESVEKLRKAVAEETEISLEILNYRRNGKAFWNALTISPILDSEERLVYFFASQVDITRRHDAEMALQRAQRLEALGQLTGGLAHDFNNLLQVMMGSLEVLRPLVDASGNPRARRRHEGALEAARRGARLTRQLLAFGRRQRLDGRAMDVNAMLCRIPDLLLERALAPATLRLDLAEGLAPVMLDSGQLEAALLNLLFNARAATKGPGEVVIATRALQAADLRPGEPQTGKPPQAQGMVELSVSDNGAGIPRTILDRVTEPFFTTSDVGQGSGLGLAQVLGFVRQSGGTLQIDSTEGLGTMVRMRFPTLDAAVELATPPARAGQPANTPHGHGEVLLVVEDNAEILELAAGLLLELGYAVETAHDGKEALVRIADPNLPLQLLFSDVMMPGGMNGISLATEARRLRPGLPVLLATGFVDPSEEAASGGSQPHGFPVMQKPYDRAHLARRIRQILDQGGGER